MNVTIMNVKTIICEKEDRGGTDACPPYEVLDILITDEKGQEHLIHLLADPGTFATKAPELDNTELRDAYERGKHDGLTLAIESLSKVVVV